MAKKKPKQEPEEIPSDEPSDAKILSPLDDQKSQKDDVGHCSPPEAPALAKDATKTMSRYYRGIQWLPYSAPPTPDQDVLSLISVSPEPSAFSPAAGGTGGSIGRRGR
jgi:hypothetical protein